MTEQVTRPEAPHRRTRRLPPVLSLERRDKLAELLTDQDVDAAPSGKPAWAKTLRALTRPGLPASLGAGSTRGAALARPGSAAVEIRRHHLWRPDSGVAADHGMPAAVDQRLRDQVF